MKKIIFVLLIVLTYKISAQEQTLLAGEITHGGFGGPEVKFTQLNEKFGVLVGGKGGWIINHTFVIGGGGYGLVNEIGINAPVLPGFPNAEYNLNFGYGGLYLEYINDWDKLLHYTVNAIIGGGSIGYRIGSDWDGDHENFENKNFFIFEPGINGEVNIASFFRINAGVSYRFMSAVELYGFEKENLEGLSGNITFKFGKF